MKDNTETIEKLLKNVEEALTNPSYDDAKSAYSACCNLLAVIIEQQTVIAELVRKTRRVLS